MHKNGVVMLAGLMGSGKSTQVPQVLLEEKEEKEEEEDDPIDGGGGGRDDPRRPPDGVWEQQRRQRLRRRQPYIVVTEPQHITAVSLAHRVAQGEGMAPPWCRGELCEVHGPQRQAGASPFLSDNIHDNWDPAEDAQVGSRRCGGGIGRCRRRRLVVRQ